MNRCCLSDLSNVITIIPFFPCPDIKHSTTEECFLLDSLTRMLILCSYQLESQYGQMAGKSVALFQNQKSVLRQNNLTIKQDGGQSISSSL